MLIIVNQTKYFENFKIHIYMYDLSLFHLNICISYNEIKKKRKKSNYNLSLFKYFKIL